MSCLQFVVDGQPQGKARPRITRAGHAYTPENTRRYEKQIRDTAAYEVNKQRWKITTEPVKVFLCARFEIPKSWPKKKKLLALSGLIYPVKKPDSDNITKVILDAMNGIVYRDDVQVIDIQLKKQYCKPDHLPGVDVKVEVM